MITLQSMTQAEFELYREHLIREYAKDHVEAGNWDAEGSIERSEKEIDGLLPQGVASPKHYLFSVHDDSTNTNVGILWFAEREEGGSNLAFIYDIELKPEARGKGYGAETMRLLEAEVRALGLNRISLHVFGKNTVARKLYEKMGFETTNVLMSKELPA